MEQDLDSQQISNRVVEMATGHDPAKVVYMLWGRFLCGGGVHDASENCLVEGASDIDEVRR